MVISVPRDGGTGLGPGPATVYGVHARPAAVTALAATLLLATTACTGQSPVARPSASVTAEVTASPDPAESLLPSPTASMSTVGELAEGFPTGLLPVPEGSEILVSAAVTDEATGLVQVTLNLRSPLPTEDLVAVYRASLGAAGFTETPVADAGLSASSTFVRADDASQVLTLGVLDRDGVRTLTVGGAVRP